MFPYTFFALIFYAEPFFRRLRLPKKRSRKNSQLHPFQELRSRKTLGKKTPRGYRKGTDSPLARKSVHGNPFSGSLTLTRKSVYGKRIELTRMHFRDMPKAKPWGLEGGYAPSWHIPW